MQDLNSTRGCTHCGATKLLKEFHPSKDKGRCHVCRKMLHEARRLKKCGLRLNRRISRALDAADFKACAEGFRVLRRVYGSDDDFIQVVRENIQRLPSMEKYRFSCRIYEAEQNLLAMREEYNQGLAEQMDDIIEMIPSDPDDAELAAILGMVPFDAGTPFDPGL